MSHRTVVTRAVEQHIFAGTMTTIAFEKWQGTGNDFIMIDDRDQNFPFWNLDLVRRMCDRNFGIGSDGLILIQSTVSRRTAYHMEFFNPDGTKSFCGNGSRCAFAFWAEMDPRGGIRKGREVLFTAIDGLHTASWDIRRIRIGIHDVKKVDHIDPHTDLINTGSPHLLCWVDDPNPLDIITEARKHRFSKRFEVEGINVNFVRWKDDVLEMRTYERGVEGETLSCGTGVTAAALSAMRRGYARGTCNVRTRGGDLVVEARGPYTKGFSEISLLGPAQKVFSGFYEF
jgi:diaminopimelate epimerase